MKQPAEGLLIYQTDLKKGFYFFDNNSNSWLPINGSEANSIAADPNDWSFAGNSVATGSFIGTTNNEPLIFKVNGKDAGQINENTLSVFFGLRAGISTTTGYSNVGLGNNALRLNTSGIRNVALGQSALYNNTSGINNFALGYASLLGNTTGRNNVGVGVSTLASNTTGESNIAIGLQSLNKNVIGSRNTAIGAQAGYNTTGSDNTFIGYEAGFDELSSNKLYIANSRTATPLIYGDFSAKFVSIGDVDPAKRASANSSGGYNLLVKGGILTEKVKVALASSADWADYVFADDYKLMPLSDVEAFVNENNHLPNVPSADQMATNGLEIAETSKMFMEKIEELTLYMIELNKEVKNLKAENESLKAALNK